MKDMLMNLKSTAGISFIPCLPAAVVFLFDIIDVDSSFWPLAISPEIVVPGSFLLLPVAMIAGGAPIRLPAIISFLIVLPFMFLEFLNQPTALSPKNLSGLTFLFGVLWLLPAVFIAVLIPILPNVRAGNDILANPDGPLVRVAFLTLIAITWGDIVLDQLPCFLGVPNCD